MGGDESFSIELWVTDFCFLFQISSTFSSRGRRHNRWVYLRKAQIQQEENHSVVLFPVRASEVAGGDLFLKKKKTVKLRMKLYFMGTACCCVGRHNHKGDVYGRRLRSGFFFLLWRTFPDDSCPINYSWSRTIPLVLRVHNGSSGKVGGATPRSGQHKTNFLDAFRSAVWKDHLESWPPDPTFDVYRLETAPPPSQRHCINKSMRRDFTLHIKFPLFVRGVGFWSRR